ncbi:hypothetical protein E2562_005262 [Oryza meyeriana var. granulata]|uniref:Uncharacterized protein n=1 Tax=Oryza meyeriana var. granulata TaxID=110450 RepID=A0A6G1EF44_9ORYZ|nr:hypothetical protein E2562_005262 [Oryza meyeriana var. granulata]
MEEIIEVQAEIAVIKKELGALNMLSDKFSEANIHEAVEQLQNVKQQNLTVGQYIDKFEEYVDLNYEKAANARRAANAYDRNKAPNQFFGNQGRNMGNRIQQKVEDDKKNEKKCWFCKEPWFPRHQCKVKQAIHALLMEEGEQEEGNADGDRGEGQAEDSPDKDEDS